MPYSAPGPGPEPLVVHSKGRLGHRRSWCDAHAGSPAGAFAPLSIPRRTSQRRNPYLDNPNPPAWGDGDDSSPDSSSSSSCIATPDSDTDDDHDKHTTPLTLKTNNLFLNNFSIPFPRSSPRSPPVSPLTSTASSPTLPLYPTVTCTTSNSIVLSDGKPLKSSLKSPSSSTISHPLPSLTSPNTIRNTTNHSRTCSAPASPMPKNVHFPSKEQGLETVCTFSRTAKPVSLSRSRVNSAPSDGVDDTETETESEGCNRHVSRGFPFPRIHRALHGKFYVLDMDTSSPVPAANLSPSANVHLESLALSPSTYSVAGPSAVASAPQADGYSLALTGTLLVRNLAYEKAVAVRFTLDEWDTTSEVAAWHVKSLPGLPEEMCRAGSGLNSSSIFNSTSSTTLGLDDGDKEKASKAGRESQCTKDTAWDRFGFIIPLKDYTPTLQRRTMWLVAQLACSINIGMAGEEWWDNNGGGNYRIEFRVGEAKPGIAMMMRKKAVSAPSAPLPSPRPPLSLPLLSSSSSASAPAPVLTSTSPHPAPQPNSVENIALSQTTHSRLGKLRLKNYAAPELVSSSTTSVSLAVAVGGFPATPTRTSRAMGLTGLGTALGASTSPHETSVIAKGNKMETSEDAPLHRHSDKSILSPPVKTSDMVMGEEDDVLGIAMISGNSTESVADADTKPRCTTFTPTQKPTMTSHLPATCSLPPGSPRTSPHWNVNISSSMPPITSPSLSPSFAPPCASPWYSPTSSSSILPRDPEARSAKEMTVFEPLTDVNPTSLEIDVRDKKPRKEKNKHPFVKPRGHEIHISTQVAAVIPKTPSSTSSSGRPSLDTDSAYRAFVKKWCFMDCPETNSRTNPGIGGPF